VCILFNCGLVTTQDISISYVAQMGKSTNGIRETSKLGGTELFPLFQVGVFTSFNCGLVTTPKIYIAGVPQIGEFANGVQET
jgi:hypothetical protein